MSDAVLEVWRAAHVRAGAVRDLADAIYMVQDAARFMRNQGVPHTLDISTSKELVLRLPVAELAQ